MDQKDRQNHLTSINSFYLKPSIFLRCLITSLKFRNHGEKFQPGKKWVPNQCIQKLMCPVTNKLIRNTDCSYIKKYVECVPQSE